MSLGDAQVALGTAVADILASMGFKWSSIAPLNIPRAHHAQVTLAGGQVVAFGGAGADWSNIWSIEMWDPSITGNPATTVWIVQPGSLPPMTGPSSSSAGYDSFTPLLDGTCLITGQGDDGTVNAYIFDPSDGSVTRTGDMNRVRTHSKAVRLNDGTVAVVGGFSRAAGTYWSEIDLYDPSTKTFTLVGGNGDPDALHGVPGNIIGRVANAVTLLPSGNLLIVGGGALGGAANLCQVLDTSTWQASDSIALPELRMYPMVTVLPSGLVFVLGGTDLTGTIPLTSALLIDTDASTYTTAAGQLAMARFVGLSFLLDATPAHPEGAVLCMSGTFDDSGDSGTNELYDIANQTFTPFPDLPVTFWTAASQLDGTRVLATGGLSNGWGVAADVALLAPIVVPTASDNVQFTPPSDAKWAQVTFKVANIPPLTLGPGGDDLARGFMQVDLRYPRGTGTSDARADVDTLRAFFPLGRLNPTYEQSGQSVYVMPVEPKYFLEDQWYRACVQINWEAAIQR